MLCVSLCRVVQVSKRWCLLAQFGTLRTRRLRYIHHKRERYLQSKVCVVCTEFRIPFDYHS